MRGSKGDFRMRHPFARHASKLLAIAGLALTTLAATAAAEPIIQLDTGGHTAPIRGIAVSPERASIMLTGGHDKVVRVWDINKGETVRTLRGEIGPGDFGNIYALDVSPREASVAVGGYMDPVCPGPHCGDVRIFNWETGKLTSLLTGVHTNIILGLAYGPNGRYLATASADDRVVIWNVGAQTPEATFALPRRSQPGKVEFLNDDRRIVTAGRDGIVRIFDRVKKGEPIRTWPVGEPVDALAVSLDGRLIAVAGNSGVIRVFDSQSGERTQEFANGMAVAALSFGSHASRHQLAAGAAASPFQVNVWDADKGQLVARHEGHDNTVSALTFSYDGKQVYSAGGSTHAINLWSLNDPGKARKFKSGGATVFSVGFLQAMRPATTAPSVAPNVGTPSTEPRAELYVAWGRVDPCPAEQSCPDKPGPLELALRLPSPDDRTLGKPERLNKDGTIERSPGTVLSTAIRRSMHADGDLRLERSSDPKLPDRFPVLTVRNAARSAGKPVSLMKRGADRGADHLSYSFSAGGSRVYTGGRNGVLDSVDPEGTAPLKFSGHEGDVWSVVDSPGGQLVASAGADQTVRLWNAETGELIVTLLYINSEKWVMWTPQGYFASSANGDRLVGWQVNRGRDVEASMITARSVSAHFFNPKLVELAILRASALKAIDELRLDRGQLRTLEKTYKPKVKIILPGGDQKIPAGLTRVKLDISDNEQPVEKVTLYVNELKYEELTGNLDDILEVDVPLEPGQNFIRVVARNKESIAGEDVADISCEGGAPPEPKGRLVLIAIGVNLYPNKTTGGDGVPAPQDLRFSVPDARAMLEKLGDRLKGRHKSVHKVFLANGAATDPIEAVDKREPTKTNIESVLDLVRKTTPDDTLMIFVAGHGVDLGAEGYIFLPTDAQWGENGWDSSRLVKWQTLQGALQVAKGRRFLFVDTCQSAGAVDEFLLKRLSDDDIVAFTAASREQFAFEYAEEGHGAFTAAVLAGLDGEADRDGDRVISVLELGNYVTTRVIERTNQEQIPDFYHPRDGRDFALMRY